MISFYETCNYYSLYVQFSKEKKLRDSHLFISHLPYSTTTILFFYFLPISSLSILFFLQFLHIYFYFRFCSKE